MRPLIRQAPLFLFLLSLFFVFHGYVENYDLVPLKDITLLFLLYLACSAVLFLIFLAIYRNSQKAAFAAFMLMFVYFFFGAIYDRIWFLAPHSFFSKYTTILGFLGFITAVVIVGLLFYKKPLHKVTYVLNVFLLLLLVVDAGWLIMKMVSKKDNKDPQFSKTYTVCDSCDKPDIYFIITDGYPGDKQLTDILNFDNSAFKNELRKRGFHCPQTRSNYNYTPFSIGSMFRLDFLQNVKGIDTDPGDLAICFAAMREARFFQVMKSHGYQLRNYSLFDVDKEPSPYTESLLPGKTKSITAQTLFSRIEKNLLYNNNDLLAGMRRRRLYLSYYNNIKAYNATRAAITEKTTAPRFIYSHLEMPHYPYYFDRNGKPIPEEKIGEGKERDTALFKEYLLYTNKKILTLVDSILTYSSRPPVIMLMSDHGYRELPFPLAKEYEFNNSAAILLPNRKYDAFYDGITNVNICRALLNVQFQQNFPMLKDSTRYVVIK